MEMKTEWEWLTKTIYEPEVTWAMVSAVATVLLVIGTAILAWAGVLPLLRARRAELTENFREELLTPTAKRILFLLAHNLLDFRTDATTGTGYFLIMPASENIIAERLGQILGPQRIVLIFEMDDEILAPLQEVAYYQADSAIDFDDAFRIFGQQIDIAMENQQVRAYITWLRGHGAPDAYRDLERLHARMNEHNEALQRARAEQEVMR